MHLLLALGLHVALAVALLGVRLAVRAGATGVCCAPGCPAALGAPPAALAALALVVRVAVLALCPPPPRPGRQNSYRQQC